jgi:hypothetical protein
MVQSYKIDSITIEPGSSGTRKISKNTTDTSLLFQDPIAGSLTLSQLAGIQNISTVYVVGPSGSGAAYTTIQSAIDATPSNSSITNPAVILIFAGTYSEDILIQKDGLFLVGLGEVSITPASVGSAITISDAVATFPLYLRLQNLRVTNSNDGEACIELIGGADSTVCRNELSILNCDLVASGTGSYQIKADTVNHIRVEGGSWSGSSATSLCHIIQCSSFSVKGINTAFHQQLEYNTTNPRPISTTCSYKFSEVQSSGNILCTMSGAGTLDLDSCVFSNFTCNGTQSAEVRSSKLAGIVLNNTFSAVTYNTIRTSISGAGTLSESNQVGSVAFGAEASKTVTLSVKTHNTDYFVSLESEIAALAVVKTKTVTNFVIEFSAPQTGTVRYLIQR